MKASLFLAVSGAALAVAKPVAQLEKRVLEIETVTDVVYVTVTENGVPPATQDQVVEEAPGHKVT